MLLLALGKVFEGQHDQHHSTRNGLVAQSFDRLERTDKAVTSLWKSLNKLLGPMFCESLAQLRDVRSQTALLNDRGGPHRTQQIIFCDRVALRHYKCDQDIKGLRRERDTFAISK